MHSQDFELPLSPAPSPVPSLRRLCIHSPASQNTIGIFQEDHIVLQFAQLDAEAQKRVIKRLVALAPRDVLLTAEEEIAPRLRHDPFRVLPIEISLRILSYIKDPKSLVAAAQVSRLWYLILSDDSTWRQLCAAHHFRRLSAAGSYVHPWTNGLMDERPTDRQSSQAIEDSPEAADLTRSPTHPPAAQLPAFQPADAQPSHGSPEQLTALESENPTGESLVAYTQAGTVDGAALRLSARSVSPHSLAYPIHRQSSGPARERSESVDERQPPMLTELLARSSSSVFAANNQSMLTNGDSARNQAQIVNGSGDGARPGGENAFETGETTASSISRARRLRSRASFGAMSGPASALTGFSRFRWQDQLEAPRVSAPDFGEPSAPVQDDPNAEDSSVAAYYDPSACVSRPVMNYRDHFARQYALSNAWANGGKLAARYRLPNQEGVIVTTAIMKDGYIALALDTSRILVFSDDGRLLRSLFGHVMGVWALALCGSTLVSGGCDRDVREWDLETGACRKIMRGHSSTVRCLAMAGSNIALSGGRDAVIRVWDLKNGKSLHRLVSHKGSVRRIEVTEVEGRQLAVSASYDCTAKVWDIESGQLLHTLEGHKHQIYSLAVDGPRIATGSLDHSIRIWDISTGACLGTLNGHSALVGQVQMRGPRLVSGGSDGAVRVCDLERMTCTHRIAAHDNTVTSLQFDGERIVTGGPDCRVQIWNTQSGLVRQLHKPGVSTVWGVAFRDDRLLTVYSEGTAIVVELISFTPT